MSGRLSGIWSGGWFGLGHTPRRRIRPWITGCRFSRDMGRDHRPSRHPLLAQRPLPPPRGVPVSQMAALQGGASLSWSAFIRIQHALHVIATRKVNECERWAVRDKFGNVRSGPAVRIPTAAVSHRPGGGGRLRTTSNAAVCAATPKGRVSTLMTQEISDAFLAN